MTSKKGSGCPSHIAVTIPKRRIKEYLKEDRPILQTRGGFCPLPVKPKRLAKGSRIYHVWDGQVREYGICAGIMHGRPWEGAKLCWWAMYEPGSMVWIEPEPMKGFQGWRYLDR